MFNSASTPTLTVFDSASPSTLPMFNGASTPRLPMFNSASTPALPLLTDLAAQDGRPAEVLVAMEARRPPQCHDTVTCKDPSKSDMNTVSPDSTFPVGSAMSESLKQPADCAVSAAWVTPDRSQQTQTEAHTVSTANASLDASSGTSASAPRTPDDTAPGEVPASHDDGAPSRVSLQSEVSGLSIPTVTLPVPVLPDVPLPPQKDAPSLESRECGTGNGHEALLTSQSKFRTRQNTRHANTRLRKYEIKARQLHHQTESKRKMLGALCVRRNLLTCDVVTMTQLVQTSRRHLDDQRDANKVLMKYIDQLTALDSGERNGKGGTSVPSNGSGAAKTASSNKSNNSNSNSSSNNNNRNTKSSSDNHNNNNSSGKD